LTSEFKVADRSPQVANRVMATVITFSTITVRTVGKLSFTIADFFILAENAGVNANDDVFSSYPEERLDSVTYYH
jgi:hypothetical protein